LRVEGDEADRRKPKAAAALVRLDAVKREEREGVAWNDIALFLMRWILDVCRS
jgi:hypothetical protein